VGKLIGHQHTAEHHQALAIRGRCECPVVHHPYQLGAGEYVEVKFQARESSYESKRPIGPGSPLERDVMILHEGPEQSGVTLLLANEKFGDPHERLDTPSVGEASRGLQESTSVGLFPELKRCD
jgi:hypothetical protein